MVQEFPGPGAVHVLHQSGAAFFHLRDGSVVVHRGTGPDARQIANMVEDILVGSGYRLIAGGGPNHLVASYRAPQAG